MFELMDVGDKNFMMNSGSYFIIMGGLFSFTIGKFILNTLARCCSRWKRMRKIGIWAYESSYIKNLWRDNLKLFVESYFDLAMCAALADLAFLEIPYGTDFITMFDTRDNAMSNGFSLLFTFLGIIVPLIAYRGIINNLHDLKSVSGRYGVFYEDNRTDTRSRALYNIYFLARRFWSVIVLVFVTRYPFF